MAGKLTAVPDNASENVQSESEVQVRDLRAKDMFTVLRILRPHADIAHIRDLVADRPVATGDPETDAELTREYTQNLGFQVAEMFLDVLTDEAVQMWLADLVNMTPEEFNNNGAFDLPYNVVMQLTKKEEFTDFLSKVSSQLLK